MANQPRFKYALLALDVLVLTTAFAVAATVAGGTAPATGLGMLYMVVLITHLFVFRMNDLYKRHIVVTRRQQLLLVTKSMITGTAVVACLVIAFVSFEYLRAEGLRLLLTFFSVAFVLLLVLRVIPTKSVILYLSRRKFYRSNLLIVGGGAAAAHVAQSLRQDAIQSFNIVGFVDDGRNATAAQEQTPLLGRLDELMSIVPQSGADEILIAVDDTRYDHLVHIVERCLETGKVVRIYSKMLDVIARKMNVEFYSAVPVIMLAQQRERGRYPRFKRFFDITLASLGLILLSPVFLCVAIGIMLSSKGPVFFRQQRVGKDGVPFDFFKFRSMHVGSDDKRHRDYVTEFIASSRKPSGSNGDKIEIFKIENDPRIFPFGTFLRKSSLDEFPQLYNVLRGEMSLVGPRPCLQYEWECYDEWHRRRLQDLPGCTGLWQALGRSTVSFEEMVVLDLYYLSNVSLWLDLKIVLRTLPVILFGRGAF
jgi:exopolysaccharide biosynthesis polyprenyl glycosylphosphotransferase